MLLPSSPQAAAAAELEAAHRKAAQALQAEIEVLRQQRAAGEAAQAALEGEVGCSGASRFRGTRDAGIGYLRGTGRRDRPA